MPWPCPTFVSIPLDVDHEVREHGDVLDASMIDRLADHHEHEPLPGRGCGMVATYRTEYVAALRYYAACVREGRDPWASI